jgi:hypothetical protein
MKWTTEKNAPAMPGLTDVEVVDGNVKSMTFDTPNGPVRISYADYRGLTFQTPAKPETSPRWKVSGKVDGLEIAVKYFADSYDAERQTRDHDGLTVTEVRCILDDTGNVVQEVSK